MRNVVTNNLHCMLKSHLLSTIYVSIIRVLNRFPVPC
jgi:hypothetical protein